MNQNQNQKLLQLNLSEMVPSFSKYRDNIKTMAASHILPLLFSLVIGSVIPFLLCVMLKKQFSWCIPKEWIQLLNCNIHTNDKRKATMFEFLIFLIEFHGILGRVTAEIIWYKLITCVLGYVLINSSFEWDIISTKEYSHPLFIFVLSF